MVWGNESDLGHMTKLAAVPKDDKNIKKNILLRNQKAADFESWYASSGVEVLPCMNK